MAVAIKVNKAAWEEASASEQQEILTELIEAKLLHEGDSIIGDEATPEIAEDAPEPVFKAMTMDACRSACKAAYDAYKPTCNRHISRRRRRACRQAADHALRACYARCDEG